MCLKSWVTDLNDANLAMFIDSVVQRIGTGLYIGYYPRAHLLFILC